MIEIHNVLNDRKEEIEFYYSVMVDINNDIDNNTYDVLKIKDNKRFFRIMKSNFLLMLYNLVEATFTAGMIEIYDQFKIDGCSYANAIDEIQNIWREYRIKEIYKADTKLSTYIDRVQEIVHDITQKEPLKLSKKMMGVNGNLNAKLIKSICDKHRIRYQVSDDQSVLDKVREKRNSLAHGVESFSVCARDLTIFDLKKIKDIVIKFISEVSIGMDKYCDEKQYLRKSDRS